MDLITVILILLVSWNVGLTCVLIVRDNYWRSQIDGINKSIQGHITAVEFRVMYSLVKEISKPKLISYLDHMTRRIEYWKNKRESDRERRKERQ